MTAHSITLIERFDLIRKIFWNNDQFAKQQVLIDAIEKENVQGKYQKELFFAHEKTIEKHKQQEVDRLTLEQKKIAERILINIGTYQYYCLQLQTIHHVFHEKQIHIYSQAYEGRMERMNQAISLIHTEPSLSSEDKEKFIILQQDYQRENSAIQAMPTTHPDGSINHKAVEEKHEEWKRIDEKYAQLFSSLLEEHQDIPQLKQLLVEEQTETQHYKEELAANELVRDQEIAKIMPHLENSRAAVKKDLGIQMQTMISILNESDIDAIPAEKQAAFANSLRQLNDYKNTVLQTQDDALLDDLTKKFVAEIRVISAVVKPPALEEKDYQLLKQRETFLAKAINLIESSRKISMRVSDPLPPPIPASPPVRQEPVQTPLSIDRTRFLREQLRQVVESRNEEGRVLDEEHQQLLSSVLETLVTKLSDLRDLGESSPEDARLMTEAEQVCGQIKPTINGEVFASKIEVLQKKLEGLSDPDGDLKESIEKIKELNELVQYSPSVSI